MRNRSSRKLGTTRAISLALSLLAGAAVLYSIYQVAAGHSDFSWAWLAALLPAVYGTYLLGTCAFEARRPMATEPLAEAEAAS